MLEFYFACLFAHGLLGLVALTQEQRQSRADDIRRALRKADLALTEAARIMRMHKSDLCNALAGINKLDDWRLCMLPDVFHAWRSIYTLRRTGFPEEVSTAMQVTPTLLDLRKDE